MARVIGLVAYHVFKESVRDKVLYNLVLFAILLIGASYLIGQLTAGQDVKIIKDLGLAASSVFGLFIAVFIGVGLVWKEVDRRSVYNLLVKPVRRHEFIVGKFLGLALTLLVNIAVMAVALYAVLALMDWLQPGLVKAAVDAPVLDPQLLKAFALLYVQLLVVTSIALFFSTFSGPDAVGGLHLRPLRRRALQRGPRALRQRREVTGGRVARQGAVLRPAQPGAVRREGGGRARPARVRQYVALTAGYGLLYGGAMISWRSSSSRAGISSSDGCHGRSRAHGGVERAGAPRGGGAAAGGRAVAAGVPRSAAPAAAGQQRHPLLPRRRGRARAALGFDAILADVYWIRAIQHFGGTRLPRNGDKTYSLLYPFLDLATSLDPRFNVAYRFGAIFLSEPPPGGPGRADQAIALLERGLAADPKRWQYAQDAGFVHYWWRQDYKAAAEWFDRAARIDGAPWWLRSMAATTLAEGGDRRSSRQLWQQLYETPDDAWVKNNAQLKLAQLDALDEIDALAAIVRRFAEARGRPPADWNDLAPCAGSRASRVTHRAPRLSSTRRPGGVALSRAVVPVLPCRRVHEEGRPDDMTTQWLVRFPGCSGCRGQLPQRLHLPAAARSVARVPAFALHDLQPQAQLVRERAGGRLDCPARDVPDVPDRNLGRVSAGGTFTGAMFAWAAWQYGPGLLLFSRLLFGCMLIVLFFIDLRHRILPNVITVGGTIVGFILSFVTPPGWVSSLLGLVIGGLFPGCSRKPICACARSRDWAWAT